VIGLMTVCQFAGILLSGAIGDRFEKRRLAASCMFFHMAGMLLLTYAVSISMLVASRSCTGFPGAARAADAGDARRLLRPDFDRTDHGPVLDDRAGRPGERPLLAGVLADARELPRRLHRTRAARRLGSVFFLLAKRPAPRL